MRLQILADPRRGDTARVSALALSCHTGTHVDAPRHLPGLRGGVEGLSLEALIGPAVVVQARRRLARVAASLLPRGAPPRILFRGRPVILESAARDLVRRRVLLVGTDAISIDRVGDDSLPAHRILLAAGVVLLEGLDLSRAPAGLYDLLALPLLIPGADGAPARAVLMPRRPRPQRRK